MSTVASVGAPGRALANLAVVEGLEPKRLWSLFARLSAIPRMSKREAAALELVEALARERGLPFTQDGAGNALIKFPGAGAGIGAPPVLIQGHLDMVTEKNDATAHDFATDPIALVLSADGRWLKADGTTLGADNGIGVCAALALLDEPAPIDLPPLELLFTVDEETGLNGAKALDPAALGVSARTLLNLDTEEWGCIYIGCAGGGDARLALPIAREPPAHAAPPPSRWELRVQGLLGGHSGICIDRGHANAVQLAARAAQQALGAARGVGLVAIDGGDKHNAIPREASAVLLVPPDADGAVCAAAAESAEALRAEYGLLEQGGSLELRPLRAGAADWRSGAPPLTPEAAERVLAVLVSLPHGVLKVSHALPGLAETSNNLAAVTTDAPGAPRGEGGEGECVRVLCSSRSSVTPGIDGVRAKLRAIGCLMGKGSVAFSPAYPGWQPDPTSRVLRMTQEALSRQLRADGIAEPPQVLAIHAGLECGLIGEKVAHASAQPQHAKLDMVSFGPTIRGAHSPDEAVEVSTVPKFYELTKAVLAQLAAVRE